MTVSELQERGTRNEEHAAPGPLPSSSTPLTWRLRRGATLTEAGATVSVWAPAATEIAVVIEGGEADGEHPMTRSASERDVWDARIPGVRAGDRYGFRVNGDDLVVPDPVSRSQPDGVHKLSEVVDPAAFRWHDGGWAGLALPDFIIYELHIGTFTPEGTFDAAAARLPDLRALGITAIEIMPVAEFPGRRNWGYDGVLHYAPHHAYGGPEGLRRLVDAAHGLGIAVVMDVVYNHVGPEGNYLDRFGPYFTEVYRTPWGRAVNYDGPGSDGVRRWAHDNAMYWVKEFHVDALRLDAVHGIYDFGALAFLEELSDEIHEMGRQLGRKVQLMAESDLNDPRLVKPPQQGGFGVDAQWADDFHHTLHALLTGEQGGYYRDFHGVATVGDVYREPFFYARRYSPHRGRTHGRSSAGVPRQRFIVCAQNHDQVGNRALGDRLTTLVPAERQRLAAAALLLSPFVPLLFMGEEYAETAPFLYFIEHGDEKLVQSVREGRMREFPEIAELGVDVDPQAEETFERSRLRWESRDTPAGRAMLALYTDLLALRREEPALRPGASEVYTQENDDWLAVLRVIPLLGDLDDHARSRRALLCAFNTSGRPQQVPIRPEAIGHWRLRLTTDAAGYGGSGAAMLADRIPDIHQATHVTDAPKRLTDTPPEANIRTITLPPWSAAVYVRDFPQDPDMRSAPAGQVGRGDARGEA
ncbi:MAG: malto-oligosyltrehalose trehalohydrolase [Gemmatimonadetes bacterium]|jgi:maltooligosyltrehalose trehalohydrolase|nr:malto-oligosyltrehalose trehalohydrolase [Gemmatimonadota bacterium]